ncbi:MAG TPA: ribosome maturation factor RimM, partial [Thermoanaerobaculia bacterium]|nr:ribosome maturation factor RimM [Thermoanaerobaculia bacterium]
MPSRPSTPRLRGPGRGAASAIPEKRIAVGIIRKAHGIHGEASVEPWSDSAERFEELENVFLVSPDGSSVRAARIEAVRVHGGRVLLQLSGVSSPEELRELQNWTIEIDAAEARKLEPGEYFLHDLVGLRLVDAGGAARGVVIDANEGGGGVLLEIERPDGRTFDLPFAAAICTNVDIVSKQMIVDLPEGIDDLDAIESVEDEARRRALTASEEPPTISVPAVVPRLRVDLVTIFPKMFEPLLAEGVLARGIKAGILDVRIWDLRDFATDKHRSTDDEA